MLLRAAVCLHAASFPVGLVVGVLVRLCRVMKRKLIWRWCRWSALAALVVTRAHMGIAAQGAEMAATNVLTLEDAVRLALASNPALRAARARVDAASGRAYQAKQWSNPELELSAEDWPVSNGRQFSDAKQTIGIAQTLPFPGKKSLDKQIGGAGAKLAEAELALRQTEIVREVKTGFYHILALERMVGVSSQLVAVADSLAGAAQRRVEAGAAPYQEQLRAEVQLEQARAEGVEYQRQLALMRHQWATLLGHPELTNAVLAGALAEAPDEAIITFPTESWLERHPSAIAARVWLEQARLAHRRARLEIYPDVKVSVAGGRMGEADQGIIELGFTLPLPLLNRGKGRQQETLAEVQTAEAELLRVRQQLQWEWAAAQQRGHTAAAHVARYRTQILPKVEEALRLVRNGFEEGKFNFMDLLDTQRTAAEARRAYWQKVLELNAAQAELEALLKPQASPAAPTH